MKIDGSKVLKKSHFGAMLSIVLFLTTILFIYTKLVTILEKNDVDIFYSLMENALDYNDRFTSEDGFFMAAALTEYDSNTEVIEDLRYGELIIEHYGWGYADSIGSKSTDIENHWCSEEELGIKRHADTLIFPWQAQSKNEILTFKKKFKCINRKDLKVWGDYNSAKGQQIAIKFKMCEGRAYCQSEESTREWLRGKYILLLYNEIRFETNNYFYESAVSESSLAYIPISSQVRQIIPHKIEMTTLELQDFDGIMLDDVTRIDMKQLFRVQKQELLPYEKKDSVWVSVTVEMNLDIQHYERKVFTYFDMLSDIGGLTGILGLIFGLISAQWNYHSFDNHMVSRLFKIKKPKDEIAPEEEYFARSAFIQYDSLPFCCDWILSWLPKRCLCCTRSRKQIALQMAREKLNKEINIIEIVKSWRYYESALHHLLPEKKRLDLKERSRYHQINPDLDESELESKKATILMVKRN